MRTLQMPEVCKSGTLTQQLAMSLASVCEIYTSSQIKCSSVGDSKHRLLLVAAPL